MTDWLQTDGERLAARKQILTELTGDSASSGPFRYLVEAPEIARAVRNLATTIRQETQDEAVLIEIVALMTAKANRCRYIWDTHCKKALYLGLPQGVIDDIEDNRLPRELSGRGLEAFRLAEAILSRGEAVVNESDDLRLPVIVMATISLYSLASWTMNSFDT